MTHGVLTTGGLIALGFGLALLFQNQPDPFHVNTWLVAGIGIAIAGLWAFAIGKGLAARRRPVTTGAASMVGLPGVARGGNVVSVKGELWNAHSATGEPLEPGEEIVVEAVEGGLTLRVRPARVHAPA